MKRYGLQRKNGTSRSGEEGKRRVLVWVGRQMMHPGLGREKMMHPGLRMKENGTCPDLGNNGKHRGAS